MRPKKEHLPDDHVALGIAASEHSKTIGQ